MSKIVISALYHFVILEDFKQLQKPLLDLMLEKNIKGTLLLAREGINGTVAGTQASIDALFDWFNLDSRLVDVRHKISFDNEMPFYRTRVKLKKEIVTMGVEGIDPNHVVGTYVKPEDWNTLISDPDVTLIDTRNGYEVDIGTFKNAVNPTTETFREFPKYVKENMNPTKHKKVAMFCTGGIRCEKSTAYLKEQGFDEVYHLQGGILKYLETVPEKESLWEGECFVFDNRVSVTHGLEKGKYEQCHACRHPVSEEDMKNEKFIQGVSCHRCYDQKTDAQRTRFSQREKQVQLAKARGEEHIGSNMAELSLKRRELKYQKRQANNK